MLSLQSTQQLLRALGTHLLSLFMGNRLGYLLMQLLGIRVGGLLLLTSYSTFSSLSRMPRIISREPRSTRSATSTSTTDFRSIRWEKKCCSLRIHFTWLGLGSFGLGFWTFQGVGACWEDCLQVGSQGEIQRCSQCLPHLLALQAHPWRLFCKSTRANPS